MINNSSKLNAAIFPFFLVEFATLSLDSDGKPLSRIFLPSDITRLLEREGFAKKGEGEDAIPTAGGDVMAVDS